MTTYSYTMELDDTECITLTAALDLLEAKCVAELSDASMAPYHAHLKNIGSIKKKLYANATQMSGNNLWPTDRE